MLHNSGMNYLSRQDAKGQTLSAHSTGIFKAGIFKILNFWDYSELDDNITKFKILTDKISTLFHIAYSLLLLLIY